jgi:4,5-DOPA dioxygenase extradiol
MPKFLAPDLIQHLQQLPASAPLPALFVGHGNPMNAIEDNDFTDAWRVLGQVLPTPKAILVISAHWLTQGDSHIVTNVHPRTIHDFYGFPDALYQAQYPASGAPDLAKQLMNSLNHPHIIADDTWGLDHGAWSVLLPMYPNANIPVLQLSINARSTNQERFELGQALQKLRYEGVLIMGSGNLVHNLRLINFRAPLTGYDWAEQYDKTLTQLINEGNNTQLINVEKLPNTSLAHPTLEHYWPLLYILGTRLETERAWYFNDSLDLGSLSMRSVLFSA